jgi:hypothetical protein
MVSTVANKSASQASAPPPAVPQKTLKEFDKAKQFVGAQGSGSTSEHKTGSHSDHAKVQGRSERGGDSSGQGSDHHDAKQTRYVNGQKVTYTDGRITRRVDMGTDAPKGTNGAPSLSQKPTVMSGSEAMQTARPDLSRVLGQPLPQNALNSTPRPVEMRSTRSIEVSAKSLGTMTTDGGANGATNVSDARTAIQGSGNNAGSSGGGGEQGGGDQGNNPPGGNIGGSGGLGAGAGGIGGGGNIRPGQTSGAADEPDPFDFDSFKRAAQLASIAEAEAMGLDRDSAVRFSKLDPALRAALRDFGNQDSLAGFNELSFDALDKLAKMLPTGAPVTDIMLDLLVKTRDNIYVSEWNDVDVLKVFIATQSIVERLDPADRSADALLDIIDAVTQPPSSPDIVRAAGRALQSPELASQVISSENFVEVVSDWMASQSSENEPLIVGGIELPPFSSEQVALVLGAFQEGLDIGLRSPAAMQYGLAKVDLRPAIRDFLNAWQSDNLRPMEVYSLNKLTNLLAVEGSVHRAMLGSLNLIFVNISRNEEMTGNDVFKVLSTAVDIFERVAPSDRQPRLLNEILELLTSNPRTLAKMTEALQGPQFADATFRNFNEINELQFAPLDSVDTKNQYEAEEASKAVAQLPDLVVKAALQYFMDQSPQVQFTAKSVNAVFNLIKMLPDSEPTGETTLAVLRKLLDNSRNETQWLSPAVLPTLMETAQVQMWHASSSGVLDAPMLLGNVQALLGPTLFLE